MPRKILIIDNDSSILNTFKTDLINYDYLVTSCSKEKCIFKQLTQETPDIVLLDIHYTEADGLDIADYLKNEEIPFIFISKLQNQSILKQSHSTGALGFLLKPINTDQLIIEIETALYFHNERVQIERRQENINITIDNNRKISVAIGLIMERYRSTGAQAFEAIRFSARTKQCRVLDVSTSLIKYHENTLSLFSTPNNNINTTTTEGHLSTAEIRDEIIKVIAA